MHESTELKEDERWSQFGISSEFLDTKAAWLREKRRLHDNSLWFFELAAKLILHARYDYLLSSVAFFQTVIGLERALRLHYDSDKHHFAELFSSAVREGVFHDELFENPTPLPKDLLKKIKGRPATHAETLSLLVPKLRNEFVHGTFLLSPEYLYLSFQMRELADALRTLRW